MITLHSINWKWIKGYSFSDSGSIMWRDNELGLQMEVHTRKNKWGHYGKGKSWFFIDKDPREFRCIDDLIKAYNEKFKFEDENPEYEVKFIKIIKKRKDEEDKPISSSS